MRLNVEMFTICILVAVPISFYLNIPWIPFTRSSLQHKHAKRETVWTA